jgi:hypothetical protein
MINAKQKISEKKIFIVYNINLCDLDDLPELSDSSVAGPETLPI